MKLELDGKTVYEVPRMALPFQALQAKKRTQIVAVDLGARATKAVYFQRKGDRFEFLNFTIQEAPQPDKSGLSPQLADHLRAVVGELGAKTKQVVLVLGVGDTVLRHAELPMVPVADMRQMLKFNAKNYLQQELPDHVYDCHILLPQSAKPEDLPKPGQKTKVIVGGAKRQLVLGLQTAARTAGLSAEMVVPSLAASPNAFELAFPEPFAKEVVALVDIGYKNTTISVLQNGQLILNRVVGIGAEKLTTGLAEALGVSNAEAEKIKLEMGEDAQMVMMPLLTPLGRELRASVDFFEHQQDKAVNQVFMSGGSARSEFIVKSLKEELMLESRVWNPVGFAEMALPPQRLGEIEQAAPQLTVAAGAALAAF